MISEVTRRNVFDALIREKVCWRGRLDEVEFLSRIFPLENLPSTDRRFATAKADILQHRIRNRDWEDDWIFSDERFGLLNGKDEVFLRFLAEMLHPVVRSDADEVTKLVDLLNTHLRVDGFELAQQGEISGRPVFDSQSIVSPGRAPIGREVELGDGTNVAVGTRFLCQNLGPRFLPWYEPAKARGSTSWEENLIKLRTRFDRLIDEFCPAECFLVQSLIPVYANTPKHPPGLLPGVQLLYGGRGLELPPAKLVKPNGEPLGGLFAIRNVQENPMLDPDGAPAAFRLGLSRYFSVYATHEAVRPPPVPGLFELLRDGSQLIYQLPAIMALSIWRNWPSGFSQRTSEASPWLDVVFEISWQRERGSPGYSDRFAWHENASFGLVGNGLFPRLPSAIESTPGDSVAHEHGYPRAFYSRIPDTARASVAAINELLERFEQLEPSLSKAPGKVRSSPSVEKGSGRTVRDFSNFCEGDIEPSLNKRIWVLIDSERDYIVYLDEDLAVEWSMTESYGGLPRGFASITSEVARLESETMQLLDKPWAEGVRRLLGEAMARIIGDRSLKEAQSALRAAESLARSKTARKARVPSDETKVPMNKCRILFLTANPKETANLALDEECREIEQKIRASELRDDLEFVTKWAVRPDDLLQYLNQYKPHVVHFSGHGSSGEEIVFLDANRKPKTVSKAALKQLFTTLKDNIRLVVLNACYSRAQAEAITEVIDCAVGMKKAVGDQAAIAFAASFYRALGFGRSVSEAFEQGKTALLLDGIPEENTPELLVRKGVDAKIVFLVRPGSVVNP